MNRILLQQKSVKSCYLVLQVDGCRHVVVNFAPGGMLIVTRLKGKVPVKLGVVWTGIV